MFQALGWTIHEGKSGVCDTVIKDRQDLYLHPTSFSGVMDEDEVPALLGGAMAASYAASHSGQFEGLILLAAYSTEDLSGSDLAVLSVYGSEDRVLNLEKYEASRNHLPVDTTEVVIEGGCHAGFGAYGPQDGDGTPSISGEEQIKRTAAEIQDLMKEASQLGQ